MSTALEVLGLSLPYSASTPAIYSEKVQECFKAAKYLKRLLELDLKPRLVLSIHNIVQILKYFISRDILTRQSFLNAIAVVNVVGGSTNAV